VDDTTSVGDYGASCIERFVTDIHNGVNCPAVGGLTAQNWLSFFRSVSRCNASLGRLVEAHYDAQSILTEANMAMLANKVFAVWASTGRSTVVANRLADQPGAALVLNGEQKFCGGAHVADCALLVVRVPEGEQLLHVDLRDPRVTVDQHSWTVDAFGAAGIATVSFDRLIVNSEQLVGPINFYGNRAGFWLGAIRVAATWAGLVDRLIDLVPESANSESYVRVQNGRIASLRWSIDAALGEAARVIDGPERFDPKRLALCVRQCVVDAATQLLLEVESQRGPAAIAFDDNWNVACMELRLALGQHHGNRDLLELGEVAQNKIV
jgi:hypothetical protein